MRRLLLVTTLLTCAWTTPAWAQSEPNVLISDTWTRVGVDRVAHFGLSYVITDQLMRAGLGPLPAIAATLLVGAAKELVDGKPDAFDFGADAAGSLAAAYLKVGLIF